MWVLARAQHFLRICTHTQTTLISNDLCPPMLFKLRSCKNCSITNNIAPMHTRNPWARVGMGMSMGTHCRALVLTHDTMEKNHWLRVFGVAWSPYLVLGLPPRGGFWKWSKWPWNIICLMSCRNPCRLSIHLAFTYSIALVPQASCEADLDRLCFSHYWECLKCNCHKLSVSCAKWPLGPSKSRGHPTQPLQSNGQDLVNGWFFHGKNQRPLEHSWGFHSRPTQTSFKSPSSWSKSKHFKLRQPLDFGLRVL